MDIASMLSHPVQETRTPSRSPSSTNSTPATSPALRTDSRVVKRSQTKAACLACRTRKSKCDGVRPRCECCAAKSTPCQYSVDRGITQQQATKRNLRVYVSVLKLLRDGSSRDCDVILQALKAHEDLNQAANLIYESRLPCQGD